MYQSIIQSESHYHDLLPVKRLTTSPGTALMTAAALWSDLIWELALELGPLEPSREQVNSGLQLITQPVFICGAHRSGTTLLRDLLDGHPGLVVLPSEGTYYTNLQRKIAGLQMQDKQAFMVKEWLRRLANPINQAPYWLMGRSAEHRSPYVDFARYVLAWWQLLDPDDDALPHHAIVLAYASCSNSLSAKMWIDKTPTNERFLHRIRKQYNTAKIIHVVRNPADILSSRKKLDPGFHMGSVLGDLKRSFKIALDQRDLHTRNYFLLRYEQLCEDPALIMSQLTDFLGIDHAVSLLQPTAAGMATMANSSYHKESVAGKIYNWQRSGSDDGLLFEEKQLLSLYLGKLAGQLGYEMTMTGIFERVFLTVKYLEYFMRR